MTRADENAVGPLRQLLDETTREQGCSLKDLTVLANQNDPFRVDTPAGHRDGAWLAVTAQDLGLGDRKIYLRGLHYMVSTAGRPKPNGERYMNTDEDWNWLSVCAGKATRWLGYLPFEQVEDHRNAEPVVRWFGGASRPFPQLDLGVPDEIPDVGETAPTIRAFGFHRAQPYKIVVFGEKSALEPVLGPFAERYRADLYLSKGEISDTLLHQMARSGVAEYPLRRMIVLCFTDADPGGWQMPLSIARKLQAFKALKFDGLDFEVHRVALTPDQVREYQLPSTPLKAKEKRGDKWREAMGVEQTEIDALASLRPDLLTQIANDAVAPFWDRDLDIRVLRAEQRWEAEAQAVVDSSDAAAELARISRQAAEHLDSLRGLRGLRDEADAINWSMRDGGGGFDLPPMVVPLATIDGVSNGSLLLDSRWSFPEQCRRLIASKAYRLDIA